MTTKAVAPPKNPQSVASSSTFNLVLPDPLNDVTLVQGQLYALNGGIVLMVTDQEDFVVLVGGYAKDSDGDKVFFEVGEMLSDAGFAVREYNAKLQTSGASVHLTIQ